MAFKHIVARHLRQPSGWLGKLTGLFMNKGNDFMNRFTLGRLEPQDGDRLLEIGFGNGKYMHEIARSINGGFIAGVDYSRTMVKEAIKRNRNFIREGRMEIKLGEVNRIPFADEAFDKVFTVNTIYFWPNPQHDLLEIRRLLKPGGCLLLTFRSKEKMEKLAFTQHGFTLYDPAQVIELVGNAGFRDIRIDSADDGSMDVHCVMAVK